MSFSFDKIILFLQSLPLFLSLSLPPSPRTPLPSLVHILFFTSPFSLTPFLSMPLSLSLSLSLSRSLQELPTVAIYYILIDEFDLGAADVNYFYALIFVPWTIKPVYAFVSGEASSLPLSLSLSFSLSLSPFLSLSFYLFLLSLYATFSTILALSVSLLTAPLPYPLPTLNTDHFPMLRYRRRPYLELNSIMASLTYLYMGRWATSRSSFLISNVAAMVFISFCEVVTDSITVEIVNILESRNGKPYATAAIQSSCMASRTFGSVLSTAISIPLMKYLSSRDVVQLTAIFPLLTCIFGLFIKEKPTNPEYYREILSVMCKMEAVRERAWHYLYVFKHLLIPMIFVFIFNVLPSAEDTYMYYLVDIEMGFARWELTLFKFVGLVGSLVGTLVYWVFFSKKNLRHVFVTATLLSMLAASLRILLVTGVNTRYLSISNDWYVPFCSFTVALFTRVAYMPTIVVAAQNCPKEMEATMYSLFSSIAHVAAIASASMSGGLTHALNIGVDNYQHLWLLLLICIVSTLIPLIIVPWLPEKSISSRLHDELQNGARVMASKTLFDSEDYAVIEEREREGERKERLIDVAGGGSEEEREEERERDFLMDSLSRPVLFVEPHDADLLGSLSLLHSQHDREKERQALLDQPVDYGSSDSELSRSS